VAPADAALVGELENSLGPRVDGRVHWVAEAGHSFAGSVHFACNLERVAPEIRLEQPRTFLGRAEDDRAAAEDPRRDRALQRVGVGGERHPRRDVRGHQAVLGDRDEQQFEEEALFLARLLAGQQEVEVLREREPAHDVAGEVAPTYLDAIGICVADPGLHARIFLPCIRSRRR